jgi:pantoate--beta-alanine ligase
MDTMERIAAVRDRVATWRARGERIAFVPTMGNLHPGHISLIELARRHGDRFVTSIFVNPMQFGPNEDFNHYPRTPERDAGMLQAAGCDLLFVPAVAEIYPLGAERATRVEVPGLSSILCGEFRPGHFEGVATVVAKLFNIVQPDVAVFGEKDYQQLAVIRRMALDLCLPLSIVGAPTLREPDGLAMSSRNQYLTQAERAIASALHAQLCRAAEKVAGGASVPSVEAEARDTLAAAGFRVDYVSVRRAADLEPPADGDPDLVVLVAARLGRARLIDNLRFQRARRDG